MRSRQSFIASSIDMEKAWFQSRYDKTGPAGTGADYINCPLTRDEYYIFVDRLLEAEKATAHELPQEAKDTPYFNGCLPIEIMAERQAVKLCGMAQ